MARLRRFEFIAALPGIGDAMLIIHVTRLGIGDNFLASGHLLPPPFAMIIAIESPNQVHLFCPSVVGHLAILRGSNMTQAAW